MINERSTFAGSRHEADAAKMKRARGSNPRSRAAATCPASLSRPPAIASTSTCYAVKSRCLKFPNGSAHLCELVVARAAPSAVLCRLNAVRCSSPTSLFQFRVLRRVRVSLIRSLPLANPASGEACSPNPLRRAMRRGSATSFLSLLYLVLPFVASQQVIRSVPLLRKPSEPTGRITLAKEGLEVLRGYAGEFGIIAAVGPTRTGKSTILGRAFLRDSNSENAFEIGGGVTSHTTGAHITDRPITIATPSGPLACFVIDTEGFSGIGGRTSRTYEANLFGLVTLMSSVLIFNTIFPVDASTVNMLNRFSSQAVAVLKELGSHAAFFSRRPPSLLWVIQNFNEFNLRNSKMDVATFHDALTTSGETAADDVSAAAAKLLGEGRGTMRRGLLSSLFSSQHLHPVHRPATSDEVVANIAAHASSELSVQYLADAAKLRALASRQAVAVHQCRDPSLRGAGARECATKPLSGGEFVAQLERWVALGHIAVDESGSHTMHAFFSCGACTH